MLLCSYVVVDTQLVYVYVCAFLCEKILSGRLSGGDREMDQ